MYSQVSDCGILFVIKVSGLVTVEFSEQTIGRGIESYNIGIRKVGIF